MIEEAFLLLGHGAYGAGRQQKLSSQYLQVHSSGFLLGTATKCDPGPLPSRVPRLVGEGWKKSPSQHSEGTKECSVQGRAAKLGKVRPGYLGWALKDAERSLPERGRRMENTAKAKTIPHPINNWVGATEEPHAEPPRVRNTRLWGKDVT